MTRPLRRIRKRPFLLLELLIALGLLVTAFFPLMQLQGKLKSALCKNIETLELAREASVGFSEVKTLLYNQSIPFALLLHKVEGKLSQPAVIYYGKKGKKECVGTYTITPLKAYRKKSSGERHLLAEVKIAFFAHKKELYTHEYIIIVEERAL